jgi:glycosyltransferase involved in cell wall biosynthesis
MSTVNSGADQVGGGRGPTPIRIVTNISGLPAAAWPGLAVHYIGNIRGMGVLPLLWRLAGADAMVFAHPGKYLAALCFLARLFTPRSRLLYYDVLVPVANRWDQRLLRALYLALVRRADLILTVQRDTTDYCGLLRLPENRFRYIGFKANSWEDADAVAAGRRTAGNGTYVLACGQSYRDYATFAAAMEQAGLPAVILVPKRTDLLRHGSLPPAPSSSGNVQIVEHDGTRASWLEFLLGARVVVIPLRPDVVQPAGVSVYLEAMNLSRPVVVSAGPATRLMLDHSIAGVVQPGCAAELAKETLRLWHDAELRAARVSRALAYLTPLGGVQRMSRDILRATCSLLKQDFGTLVAEEG